MSNDGVAELNDGGDVGHAGAVMSDIELDVDVEFSLRLLARTSQLGDDVQVIYAHANFCGGVARCQLSELQRLAITYYLVTDQHVGDPARQEWLGF